jgi:hypothetical protein
VLAVFALGVALRITGLDWGIPVYDADAATAAPELRVSFHPDEDNFLWNLVRVRPEKMDFADVRQCELEMVQRPPRIL